MKKHKILLISLLLLLLPAICFSDNSEDDILFQASTIDALMQGVYDGEVTFAELSKRGDFGLGTFNALDGEMVCLDGVFFKIKTDGMIYPVSPEEKTPFAVVTVFDAGSAVSIENIPSYESLKSYIGTLLPSKNIFYAIRIEGNFKSVKVRSVPKQDRPYRPLAEVVKDQAIFEYKDIAGTIVGFWSPAFVEGVNVTGYHMHFISEDRNRGGHLLGLNLGEGAIFIDDTPNLFIKLPMNDDFLKTDLTSSETAELNKVEGKDK